MNIENFEKLSEEKQRAIINAGFFCFGRDGYKKTAISEIAEKADISKALVFHYFGTKKELYLFLYNVACKAILEGMNEETKAMSQMAEDFFECIKLGMHIKLRVMAKHPGLYDFLLSLITQDDSELIAELMTVNKAEVERGQAMMFANVDWNRFKPEYDRAVIMNLVRWVSEGCIRQYAGKLSGEEIAAMEEIYFDVLKKTLYKEEYL